MASKTLRMSLHDIAGKDTEEDIIYILNTIKECTKFDFCIDMWYLEKSITDCVLNEFKKMFICKLPNIEIDFKHLNGYEEFVWYDVINEKDLHLFKKFKFRSTYPSYEYLATALLEFNNFVKNYHSRNGYRHVTKNCNDRFAKVGR